MRGNLLQDMRRAYWRGLRRQCYNWFVRVINQFTKKTVHKFRTFRGKRVLKRAVLSFNKWYKKRPREFTIKIRWVLAAFLLVHFWPHPAKIIAADNPQAPHHIDLKEYKPVTAQNFTEQAPAQPIATRASVAQTAPTAPANAPSVSYSGSHEDWMSAAGIAPSDYGYVDYIVTRESTWKPNVVNYLGATGLCQSLPGNKMASAGADWATNPVTQLIWCNSYAHQAKFGNSWAGAYSYWLGHHYW